MISARLFLSGILLAVAPLCAALRPLSGGPGGDTGESSLVRGPDGTTYLTWSGPGTTEGERALWFAELKPGTDTWSSARPIVSTIRLMENWADFATLTIGTDGQLWAQWFQSPEESDGHGYSGWFARSTDRGTTWSTPAPLGHEFVSLAPLSGGRVLAVWLESARLRDPHAPRPKRDPNAPRPAKDPNAPYAPSMRLKSRLLAPDGSTLQDWVVDPDVCTCCQTTLTRLAGDRVLVAYRGHTPEEIRDNLVAVFNQQTWGKPKVLHDDGWKIPACPVNGPAADSRGEAVTVAWFTAANGVARVQAKQSADGGITFGAALSLDLGRPIGRIDLVTLPDGSSIVCWLEARTEQNVAGLYLRRIFPDGRLSAPQLLTQMSAVRASGFPRMAVRDGEGLPVAISWTDAEPADPSNPKSTAVTRIRTAEFLAAELRPAAQTTAQVAATGRYVAVTRANAIEFLELCAPLAGRHETP